MWKSETPNLEKILDLLFIGLSWKEDEDEDQRKILSGHHGFSTSPEHNQLCLWQYLSMTKVGGLDPHTSRLCLGVGFWRGREGKERLVSAKPLFVSFKKIRERFWGVLKGLIYPILEFPQFGGFWRVKDTN